MGLNKLHTEIRCEILKFCMSVLLDLWDVQLTPSQIAFIFTKEVGLLIILGATIFIYTEVAFGLDRNNFETLR